MGFGAQFALHGVGRAGDPVGDDDAQQGQDHDGKRRNQNGLDAGYGDAVPAYQFGTQPPGGEGFLVGIE